MTCERCIHYDICNEHADGQLLELAQGVCFRFKEVVQCKGCKKYDIETGWCNEHSSFIDNRGVFCKPWESSDWKMFDEDDFCSKGERKDND